MPDSQPSSHAGWGARFASSSPLLGILLLAGGTLSVSLAWFLRAQENAQARQAVRTGASLVASEVERALAMHEFALAALARQWDRASEPDREAFEAEAQLYRKRLCGVQAVEWADGGGVVRWIVPESDNTAAQDLELGFEANRAETMERARATGLPALTRGIDLVQGGRGILLFEPLEREDEWGGFVLGVYRVQDLLDTMLRGVTAGLDVEIRESGSVLYRSAGVPDGEADAVETDLMVLGQPWRLRLWAGHGLLSASRTATPWIALTSGLVLTLVIAGAATIRARRGPETIQPGGLRALEGRFALGFAVVAAAAGGLSLVAAQHVGRGLEPLEHLHASHLRSAQEALSEFHHAVQEGFSYLLSRSAGEREEHLASRARFDQALRSIEAEGQSDGRAAGMRELAAGAWAHWDEAFAEASPAAASGPELLDAIEQSIHALDLRLASLVDYQKDRESASFLRGQRAIAESRSLLYANGVATALLALLVGIVVSRFLAANVTSRLEAERTAAAALVDLARQREREVRTVNRALSRAKRKLVANAKLAAVGQMSASIAHDIRNPLGSIRNAAFCLQRRLQGAGEKVGAHLEIIEHEVEVADQIISRLMDLSRERALAAATNDLADVLQEALLRAPLGPGIHCRVDLEPSPFLVWCDATLMRQALTNLIANASEGMGGRGELRIRARREGAQDHVVVEDDGPGVPPEARERLFEPFFTTKAAGTGIGLTLARQIVRAHQGQVWYEPVTDQGGAAFHIRIPHGSTPKQQNLERTVAT